MTSRDLAYMLLGLALGAPVWLVVGSLSLDHYWYTGGRSWWGWLRRRKELR